MRLERYSSEKLKQEIVKIAGRHLDLSKYRIFFFGSRVKGGGDERSDIDIGIEGAEPVPNDIFCEIEDAVDALPVLYKVELVDFAKVTPKFKRIASQHIEMII